MTDKYPTPPSKSLSQPLLGKKKNKANQTKILHSMDNQVLNSKGELEIQEIEQKSWKTVEPLHKGN